MQKCQIKPSPFSNTVRGYGSGCELMVPEDSQADYVGQISYIVNKRLKLLSFLEKSSYLPFVLSFCRVINRLHLKLGTPVSCNNNALSTLSLKQIKKVSTFKGYMTSIWDQQYWIPGAKVPKQWAMVWLTWPNQVFFSNLYSSLVLTKRSI